MALQNYDGKLGKFQYDDTEFALEDQYMRYLGKEEDGSKIHIPDGILSIRYMFRNNQYLVTPPDVPDSVIDCESTFEKCIRLNVGTVIPDGVTNTHNMYKGCRGLESVPLMPDTVEDCFGMFYECVSLSDVPNISASAKNCSRMFSGCCKLSRIPDIPDGVLDCTGMMESCIGLSFVPVIPESVKECRGIFNHTTNIIKSVGNWQIEHRGKSVNSSLENYYSKEVLDKFDVNLLTVAVDVARKYEESGKSAVYNSVISMINKTPDLDKQRVLDSLAIADKMQAMRVQRMQSTNACKIPESEGTEHEIIEVAGSIKQKESEDEDSKGS